MSDPVPSDARPTVIDNFTILRRLGAGAMGEVFLAEESITRRTVAVKQMSERYANDPNAVKRFEREIQVIAQFEHPHIAGYAGHGKTNGRPYLAVEYVIGPTLADFVRGGRRVPEDLALIMAIQIAEGLNYAHTRSGLIHRDIKPGNVLVDLRGHTQLTEDAVAKIIDFGLSQARAQKDFDDFGIGKIVQSQSDTEDGARAQLIDAGALASAEGAPVDARLTMAGQVMGTPFYMSPEQVSAARQLTFHSDLYSLGATLFHLLTGRPPFVGRTPSLTIIAHLNEPAPDPCRHLRSLRPTTGALVMKALQKTPAQRHLSWDQFIHQAKGALAVLRSTRSGTDRQQQTGTATGTRRIVPLAEVDRSVSEALGDSKPGQLTGSEALQAVTTRFIRRLKDTKSPSSIQRDGGTPPPRQP